ncbi:hypothetical protein D3C84_1206800 [compost metagenome]
MTALKRWCRVEVLRLTSRARSSIRMGWSKCWFSHSMARVMRWPWLSAMAISYRRWPCGLCSRR